MIINIIMKAINYKNKILTDDYFATTIEYILSKLILENPIGQLKFFYKKYKIIKKLNNKFFILNKDNKKIYSGIYFQETAKYIIDNIKNISKINYILFLEKELFRYKDKIYFYEKYLNKNYSEIVEDKLSQIYYNYDICKNSLISELKNYIQ